MKTLLKIISLTLALAILWSLSMALISPTSTSTPSSEAASESLFILGMLMTASLLITLPLYWMASNIKWNKLSKFLLLWLTHFSLQFAFTQIETWYYTKLTPQLIQSIVLGGLITSFLWCLLLTFMTSPSSESRAVGKVKWFAPLIAGALVFPILYFGFGYFVAWQFESVRLYYSNNPQLDSFLNIMSGHLTNGTLVFQLIRGVIWAYLGLLIYKALNQTKFTTTALIMATVFAFVMNAQLLIPNPYMPTEVRWAHALETVTSNLIWGAVLVAIYYRFSGSDSTNSH